MPKIHEQITKDTWTKLASARDADGNGVAYNSSEAKRWCLIGWLRKVYGMPPRLDIDHPFNTAHQQVADAINRTGAIEPPFLYNDHKQTTFEEIRDICIAANV
jgi:hypothetical protein